jgi:hypothetical protein
MTLKADRCISEEDGPCKRIAIRGKNFCALHMPKERIQRGKAIKATSARKTPARRAAAKRIK